MFRHRLQRRRWAARVLLLWLFGVGAGVANACLGLTATHTGSPPIANAVSLVALHHEGAAPEGGHDHGSQGDEHAGHTGHPASPGTASCQHFCDKAGISIPSLKSPFDDVHGVALFLPAAAVVVRDPAFVPVQQWVPRRDGVWALPIQIAFLRLAL